MLDRLTPAPIDPRDRLVAAAGAREDLHAAIAADLLARGLVRMALPQIDYGRADSIDLSDCDTHERFAHRFSGEIYPTTGAAR